MRWNIFHFPDGVYQNNPYEYVWIDKDRYIVEYKHLKCIDVQKFAAVL